MMENSGEIVIHSQEQRARGRGWYGCSMREQSDAKAEQGTRLIYAETLLGVPFDPYLDRASGLP